MDSGPENASEVIEIPILANLLRERPLDLLVSPFAVDVGNNKSPAISSKLEGDRIEDRRANRPKLESN